MGLSLVPVWLFKASLWKIGEMNLMHCFFVGKEWVNVAFFYKYFLILPFIAVENMFCLNWYVFPPLLWWRNFEFGGKGVEKGLFMAVVNCFCWFYKLQLWVCSYGIRDLRHGNGLDLQVTAITWLMLLYFWTFMWSYLLFNILVK